MTIHKLVVTKVRAKSVTRAPNWPQTKPNGKLTAIYAFVYSLLA